MLEQRIQQHFFDSADLKYQAADGLSRPIADAAHAVLGCITGGGKLLVHGVGAAHGLAGYFVEAMTGRFERDRPGLPAVRLQRGAAASAAEQVQALGSPGDVLLLLVSGGSDGALAHEVEQAHERDMTVVVLAGRAAAELAMATGETDVFVGVPHERAARVLEMQLLIVHCLCDAVDLQLMGEEHSA